MTTVREIMTPQLFSVGPDEPASDALEYLRMLDIHAAAVVEDESGRPVGMVSHADLTGDLRGVRVRDRMNSPAIFAVSSALVKDAAKTMAQTGFHHLVVVDGAQRAIGFLSVIDIVWAQLGWFQGADKTPDPDLPPMPQLTWTDEEVLTETGLLAAPAEPGIVLLQRRRPDRAGPATVVWAESAPNLRRRLLEIWQEPPARIARWVERGELHFRAAPAPGAATRRQVLAHLIRASAVKAGG